MTKPELVTNPTPVQIIGFVQRQLVDAINVLTNEARNSTDPLDAETNLKVLDFNDAMDDYNEVVFSGRVTFDLLTKVVKDLRR